MSSILGIFSEVQKHLLLWHICPSVHMYQLSYHRTDFREIYYWQILLKSVQKIQICLKVDKNIRHLTLRPEFHQFRKTYCLHCVIRAQENKFESIASHIWFKKTVLQVCCFGLQTSVLGSCTFWVGGLNAQRALTQ